MFGEISLMAWMGGAIVFAIGGAAGFFIARQIKDKRTLELEQQLESTQNKLTEYQSDVNRHFLKTSLLFNKLTDNYREVYDHLATGAQKLCNEKPLTAALDLPDTKILSAAPAAATDTTPRASEAASRQPTGQAPESTDDPADMDTVATVEAAPSIDTAGDHPPSDAESGKAKKHIHGDNGPATEATAETAAKTNDEKTSESTTQKEEAPANTAAATEDNSKIPKPSKAELKALEAASAQDDEDVHLGAESTPGVEPEHHKTHPSIH